MTFATFGRDRNNNFIKTGDEVKIIRHPFDEGDIVNIPDMVRMADSDKVYKIVDINEYADGLWHVSLLNTNLNTWWFKHENIEKYYPKDIENINPKLNLKEEFLFDPETLITGV
jgi:hypothetical protein